MRKSKPAARRPTAAANYAVMRAYADGALNRLEGLTSGKTVPIDYEQQQMAWQEPKRPTKAKRRPRG